MPSEIETMIVIASSIEHWKIMDSNDFGLVICVDGNQFEFNPFSCAEHLFMAIEELGVGEIYINKATTPGYIATINRPGKEQLRHQDLKMDKALLWAIYRYCLEIQT